MKNLHSGFVKLSIFILVIILTIGGVYYYIHNSSKFTTRSNISKPVQTSVVATTTSMVVDPKPEPTTTSPVQQKTKVFKATSDIAPTKDTTSCGSILNTNLSTPPGEASKLTAEEKISLACMSQAFSVCRPATLILTDEPNGTSGGTFKISAGQGDICVVSAVSSSKTPLSMGCNIPKNLIQNWNKYFSENGKINEEFSSIVTLFAILQLSNTNILPLSDLQTGQQVNVECFKK